MSEGAPSDNTLITNLKNKIAFNLHKATYDPEANKFAEEQSKQTAATQNVTTEDKTTDAQENGDKTKFSFKRVAKKVGNQTVDILKKILFPFLALMLAMIVTNEFIMYSVPIRIIFFIFVFLICFFIPFAAIILSIFYLLKGGYSYYYNNMTDRPKKDIMPTIFSLLPITLHKATSPIGSFFLYPFSYPKTEKGALKLPEIMKQYYNDLTSSFIDFDKIKNLPVFSEQVQKIQSNLMSLHEPKEEVQLQQVEENSLKGI